MLRGSHVVNTSRGAVIDTDALVAALRSGALRGAALDVTDPEPLPDGHPLWGMDNVLIISHCGDSTLYKAEKLAERTAANVTAMRNDQPLIGLVDSAKGY